MSNPQSLQERLRNIAAMDLRTGGFLAYTMDTAAEAASALDARDAEIVRLKADLAAMTKLSVSYDDDNDKYRALLADAERALDEDEIARIISAYVDAKFRGHHIHITGIIEAARAIRAKLKAAMKTEEGKT